MEEATCLKWLFPSSKYQIDNMETPIGINQRIPMQTLELAIKAVLEDQYSNDYALELARFDYQGENRIKKAARVINRLTRTNALMPFYIENKEKVLKAFNSPDDRALLLIALVNTAYPFCYDVTATLGKYFHAQKTISTPLLVNKLSAKYGTNRTLPNGLYCIMPMLIDAGFITRPTTGLYEMCKLTPLTEVARQAYTQSFMFNNPLLTDSYRAENNFYFEFV